MRFLWDPVKAQTNRAKHGVSFETACLVFDDPLHLILPDRVEDGELRWHAIGMVGHAAILLVVHTLPDGDDVDTVRIIGARKATAHERRRYEQET